MSVRLFFLSCRPQVHSQVLVAQPRVGQLGQNRAHKVHGPVQAHKVHVSVHERVLVQEKSVVLVQDEFLCFGIHFGQMSLFDWITKSNSALASWSSGAIDPANRSPRPPWERHRLSTSGSSASGLNSGQKYTLTSPLMPRFSMTSSVAVTSRLATISDTWWVLEKGKILRFKMPATESSISILPSHKNTMLGNKGSRCSWSNNASSIHMTLLIFVSFFKLEKLVKKSIDRDRSFCTTNRCSDAVPSNDIWRNMAPNSSKAL
ncbi:hypothetical protein OGAPHI_006799 [Ogataea philodendri]|uniref:Uncharacterized protein n=1 Tax=Ogataea philodendri TaxID=1378263 RepID=A0A9P8NY82_9ASCO|nr:uncharacterized protein OGAPHI_006799 [Ogataea philodendri]KAH3661392.1 hypothetical protein OGAPHI_006799 [Ogataea philodendri]